MLLLYFPLLQLEPAANKFLDYGVIGAAVVFLGFIAWKFYQKIEDNANEWKGQAKTMQDKYADLFILQNENAKKLIDIREKDVAQERAHHEKIQQDVKELPERLIKELHFAELQKHNQKPNITPLD